MSDLKPIDGGGLVGEVMIFCDRHPDIADVTFAYTSPACEQTLPLIYLSTDGKRLWKYQFTIAGLNLMGNKLKFYLRCRSRGIEFKDTNRKEYYKHRKVPKSTQRKCLVGQPRIL